MMFVAFTVFAASTCSAPLAVPPTVTAPHSTYYTDILPPKRFSLIPKKALHVTFGQAAINKLCGVPPCGLEYEACSDGDDLALPDPFTTDAETFHRLLLHELAHVAGWPDTHGD